MRAIPEDLPFAIATLGSSKLSGKLAYSSLNIM